MTQSATAVSPQPAGAGREILRLSAVVVLGAVIVPALRERPADVDVGDLDE
jgi:hypothetical protein